MNALPSRTPMVIRNIADAVAAIPYLLGFHPVDSLVVIGYDGPYNTCAVRIDLPSHDPVEPAERVAAMLADNRFQRALVVGYGPEDRVHKAASIASERLQAHGLALTDAARVSDGRWWSLTCTDAECCAPAGHPYDISSSLVAAQATYSGHVALADRSELSRTVAPQTGPARTAMQKATHQVDEHLKTWRANLSPTQYRHRVIKKGLTLLATLQNHPPPQTNHPNNEQNPPNPTNNPEPPHNHPTQPPTEATAKAEKPTEAGPTSPAEHAAKGADHAGQPTGSGAEQATKRPEPTGEPPVRSAGPAAEQVVDGAEPAGERPVRSGGPAAEHAAKGAERAGEGPVGSAGSAAEHFAEGAERAGERPARSAESAAEDVAEGVGPILRGRQWETRQSEARTFARDGGRPQDEEVAWLGFLLLELRVRDEAWVRINEDDPAEDVRFWRDILCRVDDAFADAPACLLAYAAYVGGDGGLANVALDRASSDYSMAALLRSVIDAGVPPSEVRIRMTPEELADIYAEEEEGWPP